MMQHNETLSALTAANLIARFRRAALPTARVAWLACFVVALVVFLVSIPTSVSQFGKITPVEHNSWYYPDVSLEYEFALDLVSFIASTLVTIACLILAALIVWRKPQQGMAIFVSLFLLVFGITLTRTLDSFGVLGPTWLPLIRDLQIFLLLPCLALLLLIFPNGKFVPAWTRWLAVALVPWTLVTVAFQIMPGVGADSQTVGLVLLWYLFAFVGLPLQIYRHARVSSPEERQQTKWALFGLTLWIGLMLLNALVYFFVLPLSPLGMLRQIVFFAGVAEWPINLLVVPIALAIAVTRYHLFDIDLIINRTLVYATLTAFIITAYLLVVGGAGALMQTNETFAPLLLATVVVLLILRPLHAVLQRGADHLVRMSPLRVESGAKATPAIAQRRAWGLMLARAAWFVFAALAFGVILIAIPAYLLRLGNLTNPERGMPTPIALAPTLTFVGDFSIAFVSLGTALLSLILAIIIFRRKHDNVVAILVSILLLFFGVLGSPLETVLVYTSGGIWLAWLLDALMLVPITILFYIFPDGRFVPRQTRWLAYALVPWLVVTLVSPPLQSWSASNESLSLLLLVWYLAWPLSDIAAQVYRFRRVSDSIQRQQTKWVVFGFSTSIALVFVSSAFYFAVPMFVEAPTLSAMLLVIGRLINLLVPTAFALSLAIAVLRYRLFDIDLILNRALVYGALSAFVVGMYVLSVGVFGVLFQSGAMLAPLVLASVLVVLLVRPIHRRLQYDANRLIPMSIHVAESIEAQGLEDSSPPLRGRWMPVAHIAWFVAAALAIIIFIMSLPGYGRLFAVSDMQRMVAPPAFVMLTGTLIPLASLGIVVLCLTLATLLFWRKRDEPMALVTSFFLLAYGIAWGGALESALGAWQSEEGRILASSIGSVLTFIPTMLLLFLFPSGHLVPRRARWLLVASLLLVPLLFVVPPGAIYSSPLASALDIALLILILLGLFAQVHRYRRVSSAIERQQTKGFIYGLFLAIGLGILASLAYPTVLNTPPGMPLPWWAPLAQLGWITAVAIIPLSLTLAVLRYRLWEIDLIVNRALVYGALTALIIGIFVLVVTLFGALFQAAGGGSNLLISLLATAAIAVLFQPLRERLQRAVNRLTYGERDDPYVVLTRLGQRLESTLAPDLVLPTIVETVAQALKVPYVAIELTTDDRPPTTEAHFLFSALRHDESASNRVSTGILRPSASQSAVVRLPLTYQHETLGELCVAPRTGEEKFSAADLRLLNDLARQAGVAAHSVRLTTDLQRLTADLQRSREHLVTAREEERRRLRRDLHDGLGPTLAALALNSSTVRDLIRNDSDTAIQLASELQIEIRAAVAEIRRLVYALRPPTLDELGLVASIHELANQSGGHPYAANADERLHITVEAPDRIPPLSAAVEVAAYRIAQEALTNVVRHAHAHHGSIRLWLDNTESSQLNLEVCDDGIGLPEERRAGVGLLSMRERAEELGGTFVIESNEPGGMRVVARLPIHRE